MATSYVKVATDQLNPGYAAQTAALQSQIPAIQSNFDVLSQGLAGTQQQQHQTVLEDAASRGLLKSTIPVYNTALVDTGILQQQGQQDLQRQQLLNTIGQQVAGVATDQANGIAALANQMYQQQIAQDQLTQQQQNAALDRQLQQRLADQQYQIALKKARL